MNPVVSPVHPSSVHKRTTPLTAPRPSETPTIHGRRLHGVACALLLAVLIAVAWPGTTAAQESGPYSDECYYTNQGGQWTHRRCPQTDGSNYFYALSDGRWVFIGQCAQTSLFLACLTALGEYSETYGDGSMYQETSNREYVINHMDGSVAEAGYYDSSGSQRVYRGASTMKNSAAMRNRSQMYWYYHGMSVQTVVNGNPRAFAGMITKNQASNDYMNCLFLNDSSTDFDNNGQTGFTELASYCTAQAFSDR